jgi:signal peptidase II
MINKLKPFSTRGIIILVAGVFLLDQLSKYIIKHTMQLGDPIPILGSFFQITYVENSGMAFGIHVDNRILFTILSVFALILVVYYLIKSRKEHPVLQLALSLILGGAIGNIFDRILHGQVVDFLDFEFFNIALPSFNFLFINFQGYHMTRWPVFNIADSAVTCGMILIAVSVLFVKETTKNEVSTTS